MEETILVKYGDVQECPVCGCMGTTTEKGEFMPENAEFYAYLNGCVCGAITLSIDFPWSPSMFNQNTVFEAKWKVKEGSEVDGIAL